MSNELLVIEKLELVPFFTKGDLLDDTLDKIAKEARAHVPDASTDKGRKAIKANVTKVTKSKTFLEGHGKELAAEYKAIPKAIDANRKKSKDFLNALVEEIREPLTAWEVIDKAEKQQVIDTEAFLAEYELKHEDGHRDNELFDLKAAQAEADRQAEIKAASDKAAAEAKAQAEAEASELIAQAEREKIAAEQREIAAKQAVIDAEAKAAQDAIDAAAREAKARQDVIDAKERARYEAEQAEQRRILAEQQAKQDAIDAQEREILATQQTETNRILAAQQAKRDADAAAENARKCEIRKQEVAAHQAKADQDAREANKRHAGGINTKAMNDFISCGLDEASARLAVKALAAGKIRNAGINY
jgi:hypothetical protein